MKRVLGVSLIACAFVFASTALAKSPHRTPNRFDQQARPTYNHVKVSKKAKLRFLRHTKAAKRTVSKMPYQIKKHRRYGEIYDDPLALRSKRTVSRYATRTKSGSKAGKSLLTNRINSRINCSQFGDCAFNTNNTKAKKEVIKSLRELYLEKRKLIRYEAREPAKSKALKSGCMDIAECL